MARLPVPGSDSGSWGDILNSYLSIAHNADGSLKTDSIAQVHLNTTNTPTAGQVLSTDGTNLTWAAPSNGASDASSSSKGVIQLAGDLSGTAENPTVPGLATKADSSLLANYALISSLAQVAASGSYNDLSGRPTIPKIVASSTAPSSPNIGDMWVDLSS